MNRAEQGPDPLSSIAIIGVGLVGGSLALALRAASPRLRITGWDPNRTSLSIASSRSGLLAGATPEEAAAGADLVVLCGPTASIAPTAAKIAPALEPHAVVTDVASVKQPVVSRVEAILGDRYVGGHPMAGSEGTGASAASATMFRNATWILTPTEISSIAALTIVSRMVEMVGAHPLRTTPAEHDHAVAYLSHLPHVLAYAMADLAATRVPPVLRRSGGGSLRDGTRVALSNTDLWSGILLANATDVTAAISDVEEWCRLLRSAIQHRDAGSIQRILAEARARRDEVL